MNRSEIYEILHDKLRLYSVKHNGRVYIKFHPDKFWDWCMLKINNSFIRDFTEVYICTNELVIRGLYDKMQINIPYKDIDILEVYGDEED